MSSGDAGQQVMSLIGQLEDKVREKNQYIAELKRENFKLQILSLKTVVITGMLQPWGALLVGFAVGGGVVGLILVRYL